jgi:hypothetical protein
VTTSDRRGAGTVPATGAVATARAAPVVFAPPRAEGRRGAEKGHAGDDDGAGLPEAASPEAPRAAVHGAAAGDVTRSAASRASARGPPPRCAAANPHTSERHPVAARLLRNTWAQIALMRPDPRTRALWEMFSDLMDLDDAPRYVADMRPGPDVVTAVTRSADLLRTGVGFCWTSSTARRSATPRPRGPDGSTPSPPARTGWTSTRC